MDEENKQNEQAQNHTGHPTGHYQTHTQHASSQTEAPRPQYYHYDDEEEKSQTNYHSWMFRAKDFLRECSRVLKVTKKPDLNEFKAIVKVSGLGIIIIGLLGFIVQMVKVLFFG